MKADSFTVEITDEGVFKVSTDPVSKANHGNAEKLMAEMFASIGEVEIKHKHGKKWHRHLHDHKEQQKQ